MNSTADLSSTVLHLVLAEFIHWIQGRLQAAAQGAFHLSGSCQALFNELANVPF